jgi:hypothetical protein
VAFRVLGTIEAQDGPARHPISDRFRRPGKVGAARPRRRCSDQCRRPARSRPSRRHFSAHSVVPVPRSCVALPSQLWVVHVSHAGSSVLESSAAFGRRHSRPRDRRWGRGNLPDIRGQGARQGLTITPVAVQRAATSSTKTSQPGAPVIAAGLDRKARDADGVVKRRWDDRIDRRNSGTASTQGPT